MAFNGFTLGKLDDGRLYWIGDVTPGVYETKFGVQNRKTYTLLAVYQNNFPMFTMGYSIYVYPLNPDASELIDLWGFRLHFLSDSDSNLHFDFSYDCHQWPTNTPNAASMIYKSLSLLTAAELVLVGELSKEDFLKAYHRYEQ